MCRTTRQSIGTVIRIVRVIEDRVAEQEGMRKEYEGIWGLVVQWMEREDTRRRMAERMVREVSSGVRRHSM